MTDEQSPLLTERVGHVLVLTLNRPQARNAMNLELAGLLGQAVEELTDTPELRAAVLTGAGTAFCAGQDLKALVAGEALFPSEHPEWGFGAFVGHFTPKPIVAAIHGFAFGGGLELALACDLIVAAEGTALGLPEVTRGLFAAGGGVGRISQQLPEKIANRLLLTGEPITAEEALRWGLVNEVVPEAQVLQTAIDLATRIAENSPASIRVTKRLTAALAHTSTWTDEYWMPVYDEVPAMFASPDGIEGATAFAQKRPPVWRS